MLAVAGGISGEEGFADCDKTSSNDSILGNEGLFGSGHSPDDGLEDFTVIVLRRGRHVTIHYAERPVQDTIGGLFTFLGRGCGKTADLRTDQEPLECSSCGNLMDATDCGLSHDQLLGKSQLLYLYGRNVAVVKLTEVM
jgi:hypothetical protein